MARTRPCMDAQKKASSLPSFPPPIQVPAIIPKWAEAGSTALPHRPVKLYSHKSVHCIHFKCRTVQFVTPESPGGIVYYAFWSSHWGAHLWIHICSVCLLACMGTLEHSWSAQAKPIFLVFSIVLTNSSPSSVGESNVFSSSVGRVLGNDC